MPFSFRKLLWVAVGSPVCPAAAVYEHRFVVPDRVREVVEEVMLAHHRSARDVEEVIEFLENLSPSEGESVVEIDRHYQYLTG